MVLHIRAAKAGHQREAFEAVLPELRFAAEAAQLDHRQQEIEAVLFGLQRDGLVEIEAGQVLRRVLADQPAVVVDRNEDAHLHLSAS
jgi:hypothetical protein